MESRQATPHRVFRLDAIPYADGRGSPLSGETGCTYAGNRSFNGHPIQSHRIFPDGHPGWPALAGRSGGQCLSGSGAEQCPA